MKTPSAAAGVPHLAGERIELSWRNPPASEFVGDAPLVATRIVRRERSFALGPDDGDVIYHGRIVARFVDNVPRPLRAYYYTIFAVDGAAAAYADEGSRVAVYATASYRAAEQLYQQLPAVHQRHDKALGAPDLAALEPAIAAALQGLPGDLRGRGQLFRFLQAAAAPVDVMRSFAEGLRDLRDVDSVRPEFLLPLAEWLGWQLDQTMPVFAQRNEIKFAPRLYRSVGTVPNLRRMITRYTGWQTQVAEFAQHIALSNSAPMLNIHAVVEEGGRWRGVDDAGPVLGFASGNDLALGSAALPAVLVGTVGGPFALRPGMELGLTLDDGVPLAVRFLTSDFARIGSATAAEVASVINRVLSAATATALGTQRIELRSHRTGPDASIRVDRVAASLVTFEGAPRGRLAVVADATPATEPRVRLLYETADPLAPAATIAAVRALQRVSAGDSSATGAASLPAQPLGSLRYKTFRGGTWGPSLPLPTGGGAAGDPTAIQLTPGRLWVGWIDAPNTSEAALRFMVGSTRIPRPARLVGQRSQPFRIASGSHLLIGAGGGVNESVEFSAADFADPLQATAVEVAAVVNARLRHVFATVEPNQSVVLSSVAVGGDQRIELDLRESSAAAALGFDATNASATGDWGDEIDWGPVQAVMAAAAGPHADVSAVLEPPPPGEGPPPAAEALTAVVPVGDGGGPQLLVRLFWATHEGQAWRVVSSRWDGGNWSAVESLGLAPGGNREPVGVIDTTGRTWLFWSGRQGTGGLTDNWTLRWRIYDPFTDSWGVEVTLPVPPSGRARDREPGAILLPDGNLRVFFQSNRSGGPDLWSVTVLPSSAITALGPAIDGAADDRAPAPVRMPTGAQWLLFRSDRSVPLAQAATRHESRVTDVGTRRRFAGGTTPILGDVARNGRTRRLDDLLSYTPQGVSGHEILHDDDFYTRGTLGLYVSGVVPESPVSVPMVERLGGVLERFLPINTRAVVILAPRVDIEQVYSPGADVGEIVQDKHPDIEFYSDLDDAAGAALPDWVILHSTTAGHVSANPAVPSTLRRRTYFPPPS